MTYERLRFSKFKKDSLQVSFSGASTHADITEFSNFLLQLKTQRFWSKTVGGFFYYFDFERNYDVLKSNSPCFLLNRNININENETESKMKNPRQIKTTLYMVIFRRKDDYK